MQVDFEHISETTLSGPGYLEEIIGIINAKAGVREDDDRRRAYRQAITDSTRHRDESLAQYAQRRMRDFQSAAAFGVEIPPMLRAMLLREGSGLNEQGQQNLVALLQGREDDPESVGRALARMDVRHDRLTAFGTAGHEEADGANFLAAEPVDHEDDVETDEEDSIDHEEILKELEPLDLNEDQITEVFAVLEHKKRRSWKQNKLFKADVKKDRGSFVKDGNQAAPRGHHGGVPAGGVNGRSGQKGSGKGRPRRDELNSEQLKKVSICRLCLKKGHWAEDCHKFRNKGTPAAAGSTSAFAYVGDSSFHAGLTFMTMHAQGADHLSPAGTAPVTLPGGDCTVVAGQSPCPSSFLTKEELKCVVQSVLETAEAKAWAFLTLAGGEAILDIGATQDLIGSRAMEALQKSLSSVGLQAISVDKQPVVPSGIGGTAKVEGVMLVPISPGGVPGVLEVTVLVNDIPPLLSVGFLEFLQAGIDLVSNVINLRRLGLKLPMKRLPSGHRTISLIEWRGGSFPVPPEIQQRYGIQDGAFNIDSRAPCAYTKGAAATLTLDERHSHGVTDSRQPLTNEPNTTDLTNRFSCMSESRDLADVQPPVACREQVHTGSSHLDLVDEGVVHEGREVCDAWKHDQTSHDADPQCPQQQVRSSEHMGLSHSANKPKFDRGCSRNGTTQFSSELRDQHSREVFKSSAEMDQDDASASAHSRDCSDELRAVGTFRDGDESLTRKCHEATRTPRTCSGKVPSPSVGADQPMQPVCLLDGVQAVPSKDVLPISAGRTQQRHWEGKGNYDDHTDAKLWPTRDSTHGGNPTYANKDNSGDLKCGNRVDRDLEPSIASHEHAKLSVRAVDVANSHVTSGTCSGTESDDHVDAGYPEDSNFIQHGRGPVVDTGGVGESQPARAVKPWPKWMVATGAAACSMWLTWADCSTEFQSKLRDLGMSDETYLFQYDLRNTSELSVGESPVGTAMDFTLPVGVPLVESAPRDTSELSVGESLVGTAIDFTLPVGVPLVESAPRVTSVGTAVDLTLPADVSQVHEDVAPRHVPDGLVGTDWKPAWIPDFAQKQVRDYHECEVIGEPSTDTWHCLWQLVQETDSGQILENGPCPTQEVLLDRKMSVRVTRWGVPTEFLRRCQFSNFEQEPLQLDDFGQRSSEGMIWAFPTALLSLDSFLEHHAGTSDSGTSADMRRCAANLTWLSKTIGNQPQHIDFAELFSPPRVTPEAQKLGLRVEADMVFDIEHGWDVRSKQSRQKFRKFQQKRKPKMLMCSPVCKAFTAFRHLNHPRMNPQRLRQDLEEGKLMWNFSLEACQEQQSSGDYFGLEHPARASSWGLPQTQKFLRSETTALITFDMCALGLSVVPTQQLSEKTTKIATNNPWLAHFLTMAQCSRDHEHQPLVGGLAARAQEYPYKLCQGIAQSAQAAALHFPVPSFLQHEELSKRESSFQGFGEEEEDPEDVTTIEDGAEGRGRLKVSESQMRLVHRVHTNLGHPPRDRLLRAFRSAGALPQVLDYIRHEFKCDDCDMRQKTDVRRKATLPRTYSFNKILGIDVFYVKWQDQKVPILNMIDLGTSYQIAVRMPIAEGTQGGTPTSLMTWQQFSTTWLRYYGAPQMIICDCGNEFRGHFERSLENCGIFQHVIHPESPWENGVTERHGGWVKNRVDRELASGRCVLQDLTDLDELLAGLTSTKNNYLNKGGFSPSQLVFGQLTRIPGELLAEDDLSAQGMEDAYQDPLEVDEAAGEYRRRHAIRLQARQLAMNQDSKDAIQGAAKAAPHQGRQWSPGQWVYVFRRAKAGQELHLRNRWVGPGIVVLSNNNTVYVGMRSRLWRCSAEQIRPALPSEILGKDLASDPALSSLLRKVISGTRAGAVDVIKEGPPPQDARWQQVEQVQEGAQIAEEVQVAHPVEHAPQEPRTVPPGIIPQLQPSVRIDNPAPAPPPPASQNTSRRSSTTEPAVEPGPQIDELNMLPPPGLTPIAEADDTVISSGDDQPAEPPVKMLRTVSPEEGPASAAGVATGSSSSSTTRAPGTPVRRLLDNIPRLTPSENLEPDGRVARQIGEFNRVREGNDEEFFEEGWSGSYFNYQRGDQRIALDEDGQWTFLAKRNDEISLKELNAEELKKFGEADKIEWEAILKTKAVKVVSGDAAQQIRSKFPDRIISSRMVRRKKPIPELHGWKAKSRWCLHGHCDPDTGTLTTYAPTPQSEGLMMFLQTAMNYSMTMAFADVKNAFCQSNPLRRKRGPIYAEPCEGLHLPPGALIEIIIPVYGLDDAPAAWRLTVAEFLLEIGFERNLVEPCWYSKFEDGVCTAMILVEVDDFIVAADENTYSGLKENMQKRFLFGKWDEGEAEYAGRHIKCTSEAIFVDQYKYIQEQIHPIVLAKGRRQHSNETLTTEEFNALRSLIYKVNWVARESRPEAAGIASILASKLKWAKVSDILTINKFVNFLRSTADRSLKLWKFNPKTMVFVVCSDAGGINTKGIELEDEDGLPTDATQGAWLVMAAEKLPSGRQQVRASPIAWRSSKLKRKVFSTYGGETQAMLQGVNEVDWLQVMYRDATAHDVELGHWRNSLSPHMLVMRGQCSMADRQQQCSVTDAKSLYDCLLREHPTGKQDRKSALELSIILKDLQETKSMVRWVPHQKMVVDCLTKEDPLKANDALNQFIKTGILSLVDIQEELQARKCDPSFRRRSHAASRERLLGEYQESFVQLTQSLVNYIWGSCELLPLEDNWSLDQGLFRLSCFATFVAQGHSPSLTQRWKQV